MSHREILMRAVIAVGLCFTACATAHAPRVQEPSSPPSAPTESFGPGAGAAIPLDERMTPPVKLWGPNPSFTPKAIANRVEGTMVVTCRITVEGSVVGCRVLKGLPYLDAAVVDALQKRRYRPAMLDGKPVEVNFNFKITMRLGPGM